MPWGWDEITEYYLWLIDNVKPKTLGWHLKPGCRAILEIIPKIRANSEFDEFTVHTSHVTVVFKKPDRRLYVLLWGIELGQYGICYQRQDSYEGKQEIRFEQVIPTLRTYLQRLKDEE